MKKYLFSLLVVSLFIVPFIGLAQTTAVAPCPVITRNLTLGSTGPEVTTLQQYLIDEGFLNSDGPTGYFGKMTKAAVQAWQKDHNVLPNNGFFGVISRAVLNALCGEESGLSINSVSGPTSLAIGQTGTWAVNATAPSGTNLKYSVDWGDVIATPVVAGLKTETSQTSTFTHSYGRAGTYTVRFLVSDNSMCGGAAECDNFKYAKTSITVVVGDDLGQGVPKVIRSGYRTNNILLEYNAKEPQSPWLVGIFYVDVIAENGDILIPLIGAFRPNAIKRVGNVDQSMPPTSVEYSPVNNWPMANPTITKVGENYKIAKGNYKTFLVKAYFDTSKMFAGSYFVRTSGIAYRHNISGDYLWKDGEELSVGYKTIVGEQGPYISGVTTSYDSTQKLTVVTAKGERLSNVNIYFNGRSVDSVASRSTDGREFHFNAIFDSGNYPLYVQNAIGKSNTVHVTISGNNDGIGKPIAKFSGGPMKLLNGTLGAAFAGTVTASGGDIYLPKDWFLNGWFNDNKGIGYSTNGCKRSILGYGATPSIVYDKYGVALYKLEDGGNQSFKLEISCPVNELFAGIYKAQLGECCL